jgi:hypothetical protein
MMLDRCYTVCPSLALRDGVNGAWNRITNALYIMHAGRTQGSPFVIPYQAGFT